MPIPSRATLKANFVTGLLRTDGATVFYTFSPVSPQAQYGELIDVIYDFAEGFTTTIPITGLLAGLNLDVPHDLGATPRAVRGVLLCDVPDLNYAVGDEVGTDIDISTGASPTNVFAVWSAPSASITVADKSTGAFTAINPTSWSFKLYARL